MHSDSEEEYTTPQILKFFKEENIKVSVAISDKHQNQVSEALNNQIKYFTALSILDEHNDTKAFRKLINIQPDKFNHKSKTRKAQDKKYRKWFFDSQYFREKAIVKYNERQFVDGITRKEAEYYNTKTLNELKLDFHIIFIFI